MPLVLSGLAVAAAQWGAASAPVANVSVGARLFAPGEAFDGEALPADHAVLITAGTTVIAASDGAGAPAPPGAALSWRRFCAWGRPGRMPYRGTVDEALRAAQLPAAVREQLAAAIAARRPHDRLTIGNGAIRAIASGRLFDAQAFAMTYGRTLCLDTRVNFKPGHVEPASLYEALDAQGTRYSVMVPDVCGNISVITASGGGFGAPRSNIRTPGERDAPGSPASRADKPNEVPAPGTLALSLLALAVAALARHAGPFARRRR